MAARQRVYSPHTREAVALLGRLVRTGRIERRMTASDVSERAGITRVTLRRANREAADRLTLLPRHAHSPRVDDDF
jgi:hypothetical protein